MSLREALETQPELFVRQRKEWAEILVDWETRNHYVVLDAQGAEVGVVAERGAGLGHFLRRALLRSHRPLDVAVLDRDGTERIRLSRPFFWLFSSLAVRDAQGAPLGRVERRFGLLHRRYDLHDATDRVFARIAAPRWRIWTFAVEQDGGLGRALISKKWGGVLREVFADADTFRVAFEQGTWTPEHRAVVFAAALSIDFDFFENNQGKQGGLLGGRD